MVQYNNMPNAKVKQNKAQYYIRFSNIDRFRLKRAADSPELCRLVLYCESRKLIEQWWKFLATYDRVIVV